MLDRKLALTVRSVIGFVIAGICLGDAINIVAPGSIVLLDIVLIFYFFYRMVTRERD